MGFIEYVAVKYDNKSTKKMEMCCCKVVLYHEVGHYYLQVDSTKLKINTVLSGDLTEKIHKDIN